MEKLKRILKKLIVVLGKIILTILMIPFYLIKAVFGGFIEGWSEGSKKSKDKPQDDLQWIDEIECIDAILDDDDY